MYIPEAEGRAEQDGFQKSIHQTGEGQSTAAVTKPLWVILFALFPCEARPGEAGKK